MVLIDIGQLRIGMYIQLDMGWMNHPFPVSSFRIASPEQIDTLRGLGLKQVRCIPSKSDVPTQEAAPHPTDSAQSQEAAALREELGKLQPPPDAASAAPNVLELSGVLQAQWLELQRCERSFDRVSSGYHSIVQTVDQEPLPARALADDLVGACVQDLLNHGDAVIRLLSEDGGVRSSVHPVNVMVLSLLLGRALDMDGAQLHDLGVAALLHDLGKNTLPVHVHEPYGHLTGPDLERYRGHVGASVAYAERMGLPVAVVLAIAQHHERVDGSGFPLHLFGEDLSMAGQILALVNHYERLCNPSHGGEVLTPHEALSVMYAKNQRKFDTDILRSFLRMMGIFPPGSVVQLSNDRFAIVVTVNASRPLRPSVIVYDPSVPRSQALILDLETVPTLTVRRTLRPSQLPRDALDYLSPRQRICYFFERSVGLGLHEAVL